MDICLQIKREMVDKAWILLEHYNNENEALTLAEYLELILEEGILEREKRGKSISMRSKQHDNRNGFPDVPGRAGG